MSGIPWLSGICSTDKKLRNHSLKWSYHFVLHQQHMRITVAPHPRSHLPLSLVLISAILGTQAHPSVAFMCISLVTVMLGTLHVLIAHLYAFFAKVSLEFFPL